MDWFDLDGAAAYLGRTPRFVKRLIDERRIPCYRIGGLRRFLREDLDAYIAAARVAPREEASA